MRAEVGSRLSDPKDPAVRLALERKCSDCEQEPNEWCVGIAEGPTKGKRRTRLHFARCMFAAWTAGGDRVVVPAGGTAE